MAVPKPPQKLLVQKEFFAEKLKQFARKSELNSRWMHILAILIYS